MQMEWLIFIHHERLRTYTLGLRVCAFAKYNCACIRTVACWCVCFVLLFAHVCMLLLMSLHIHAAKNLDFHLTLLTERTRTLLFQRSGHTAKLACVPSKSPKRSHGTSSNRTSKNRGERDTTRQSGSARLRVYIFAFLCVFARVPVHLHCFCCSTRHSSLWERLARIASCCICTVVSPDFTFHCGVIASSDCNSHTCKQVKHNQNYAVQLALLLLQIRKTKTTLTGLQNGCYVSVGLCGVLIA